MVTQSSGTARLPLLDGLRGLAAIAVMLYHVETFFGDFGPFSRGYLFVDFFFLLSGFVLTLSAESKMNAGLGAVGFMRARLVRLWPVIAAGALVGAVCYGMTDGWDGVFMSLILALLIVPAVWSNGQIFPLNGPQWSLMLELFANLAHGLVLRRLNDFGLLAVVIVSGCALLAVIFAFGSNTLGPFAFNWWYAIPRVAFAYTLGIWMGRKWMLRDWRQLVSWEVAFLLPGLAIVILARIPVSVALGDGLASLVILPGLFWLAATTSPPAAAQRWLSVLGALSFPLYAVHVPIINLYATMGNSWQIRLLAIASAVLAAQILAMTLERKRAMKGKARPVGERVSAP
ncbi:MAG: acyltransferase [Novosphingobium sp.]